MRVLVACEFSGVVRDAFRRAGHDAYSCDLEPSNSIYHYHCDVKVALLDHWDMMIAHPPCTYLSAVGERWMTLEREELRMRAYEFVMQLWGVGIEKTVIENPAGALTKLWRPPDQYIQPCQYGHPFTKRTGLWLRGLPLLRPTQHVYPEYALMSKRRSKKARQTFFTGVAEAMATQWGVN